MRERALILIPPDTESSARSAFHPNHYYMRLGRDLARLLDGIDVNRLNGFTDPTGLPLHLVALLTVFQYREQLSDFQTCEAGRTRIDWKYALHLPLLYPEIHPAALCLGRSLLRQHHQEQRLFQDILDRLVASEYLSAPEGQALTADAVLGSVCLINRLHEVRQAMSEALLSITAARPNWVRLNMLPHWLNQYSNLSPSIPETQTGQVRYAQAVGRDIRYLLARVDADPGLGSQELPAIKALRAALRLNYQSENLNGEDFSWRLTGCAYCPRNY